MQKKPMKGDDGKWGENKQDEIDGGESWGRKKNRAGEVTNSTF